LPMRLTCAWALDSPAASNSNGRILDIMACLACDCRELKGPCQRLKAGPRAAAKAVVNRVWRWS
jgi:hypothetical protein